MVIDLDLKQLGRELARMDSRQQGEFFRAFAESLFHECRNPYNTQMQMHYIEAELSDWHKELLGWKE